MNLIIDFYKSLDMLNLIIFWGIIIVIILLLIFSFILINKNKKLKKIVETGTLQEDLPIKKIDINEEIVPVKKEEFKLTPNISKQEKITEREIQEEKKFIAEEHIINYHNVEKKEQKNNPLKENRDTPKYKNKEIEIPTKPYQRNVLKEMALSQTSPIGITKPREKEEKNIERAKDLQQALSDKEEKTTVEEKIKQDLSKITVNETRKTKIVNKLENNNSKYNSYISRNGEKKYEESPKKIYKFVESNDTFEENKSITSPAKELFDSIQEPIVKKQTKSTSEIYLEEVSKKLSEAEILDEIDRTEYELEQEENAIISYKELMEKKDSIQTIDEEEAIISIEELMNRNTKHQEPKESSKLYNINNEEGTDEFINQLKQFRSEL